MKEANEDNAAAIPRKLALVGYRIHRVPKGNEPKPLELTPDELETIAKAEHARWNWQKLLQGWVYKDCPRDMDNRTSPHLRPWRLLGDDVKEWDLNTARQIRTLLETVGYEAQKIAPKGQAT